MDFVTIGNPGNAADTTGNPNPGGEGLRQGALRGEAAFEVVVETAMSLATASEG